MSLVVNQTLSMFLDAYRELNARKLFWVTLGLSGLIVLIYAAIGIDQDGLSFFGFKLGFIPINSTIFPPDVFYKMVFLNLGVGIWLTWIATALALISTAQIIPEFVAGGSIEMSLSKPIGRVRLFMTRYFTGLLFVALQVTAFSLVSFAIIGIRGKSWEPGIFLSVPIVVLFFSYLYCIQALVGLLTRSTIASLMAAGLFWLLLFIVNTADTTLLMFQTQFESQIERYQSSIAVKESNSTVMMRQAKQAEDPSIPDDWTPSTEDMDAANPSLRRDRDNLEDAESNLNTLMLWYNGVKIAKAPLPKTQETTYLLERTLIAVADLPDLDPEDEPSEEEQASRDTQLKLRERSPWFILGTSIAFETVILGICCLIFGRRDF